ncbi:type II toxin-antitoxin system VapC family toxin [Cognataquiflexum rubidum]|uniref:type II toxin-antitoxin system VapC family toxin n=1 Tax=Cognataquiflexum rubidum TaxID=2922273 RepID=UPI001F134A3A|nr:type II toxin-antitoxin system VapC family toxin [Cognataquiflexum rubidum]MCH6234981.1 type II toxin-antitoxin system VapC family toxin [Cognataquiflexum rubidum]
MADRKLVIDTSIFIEFLRSKKKEETILFNISKDIDILTSSITQYELLMGASNQVKIQDVEMLLKGLEILPFNEKAAIKSAQIYHELKKRNKLIEFRDIFIASICMINNSEILSLNKKHFQGIEGLELFHHL